jgi:phage terminase small subunit
MNRRLTPKQEMYASEYAKTGDATGSYRLAYNFSKMKPNTVYRKAHEVLRNGKVAARIDGLRALVAKKYEITLGHQVENYLKILAEAENIDDLDKRVDKKIKIMARLDKIGGLEDQERDKGSGTIIIQLTQQDMCL